MSKTERLQVLIDVEQRERLEQTAAARGVSVASLVRSAIDVVYPTADERRRLAGRRILDAETMEVPDAEGLKAELDEIRTGKWA